MASGLSENEIKRMVEDAERHADEDAQKRKFQEVVNQAEILLYSTEQTLKDFKERFSDSDLAEITAAIEDLKQARDNGERDLDAVSQATGRLQAVMHRFAELIYSAPDTGEFQ